MFQVGPRRAGNNQEKRLERDKKGRFVGKNSDLIGFPLITQATLCKSNSGTRNSLFVATSKPPIFQKNWIETQEVFSKAISNNTSSFLGYKRAGKSK